MEIRLLMEIRVDSYEAGTGRVGGLATFHNALYPQLAKKGFSIKTFSMNLSGDLPTREDFESIIIRRPSYHIDLDTAYVHLYDVLHQLGIEVSYLRKGQLSFSPNYFTGFVCVPTAYRMATIDLFIPNDWFSYVRSALNSWIHPDLCQQIFIHSTEPGRTGGVYHANFKGHVSDKLIEDEFNLRRGDAFSSFTNGQRLIRDLEFPLTYRILKKLHNNAVIFAVSRIHRKEYLFGVKLHGGRIGEIDDRVFAIYHGIDPNFFKPDPKVEKLSDFTIGFIGRSSQVKGIHILPDLASLLIKKIPELKMHIVTAADQRDPEYLFLLKRIHELNLNGIVELDNTFYVGPSKAELFNKWHLMICPSLYEPQGQIDLEAMSSGVPPLVGLGGLREKVVDGYDGVWINPYDANEIAEKVIELYQGSYKGVSLEEMAKNGRDSAENVWDWEKRAEAHKEVIQYLEDGLIDHIEPELGELMLPKVDLKS